MIASWIALILGDGQALSCRKKVTGVFLESFNMRSSEGLLIVGRWIFLLSDARQAHTHAVAVEGPLLADLLHRLLRQPLLILLLWNWKSALLSMILRGPFS
jgi:hypothetical protein